MPAPSAPVSRPHRGGGSPLVASAAVTASQGENSLVNAVRHSPAARSYLLGMIKLRKQELYECDAATMSPPNTVVSSVLEAFEQGTDIALEIPLFTMLSFVAAHLLHSGSKLVVREQTIQPTIWNVVLAPSGSGKSYVQHRLHELLDPKFPQMPEAASAAKWIEDLRLHNNGIWLRDEFGQLLKSIEQQTHMAELRDYLLRVYDGARITRRTREDEVTIERPALVILGFNVDETWSKCVSAETLVDGFAQRMQYCMASSRETVRAFYDLSPWSSAIRRGWEKIELTPLHEEYEIPDDVLLCFEKIFHDLHDISLDSLPMSFVRRILFSTLKYSLIYHVLLQKTSVRLDAEDIIWGARVARRHLIDAARLLDSYGVSELEMKVRRIEELLASARANGKVLTARAIIRARGSQIKTAREARDLLALVLSEDPHASPDEVAEASKRRGGGGGTVSAAKGGRMHIH